ncbi:ABC transporter permease subunit [Candidatus Azambacteria bacterium]|nr:ABC transporter permease subunit [Candidatus Azambacteria bacterium]
MTKGHRLNIYETRRHLFFTVGIIMVPFVFLLLFSQAFQIPSHRLFFDVLISFSRLAVAYVIAATAGWVLAVSFYRGRRAVIALPIFDVLQSLPVFAVMPFAVFFWGASNFTVIFFLVLAIVWPVFFSIISSMKLVKHDWNEAAQILGLSGFQYIARFLFPVSVPGFITGSIIGLGDGWEALVATEIIVGMRTGMGNFFQSYSHDPAVTSFGVLGFLILIFAINKAVWIPLLDKSHARMEE